MLAFLLAASMIATDPPAPVSIALNQNGRYLPGSGVQVTVHAGSDGYLLVLNADPDGRVRVLFPLDPTDDAYVKGGRKYQLESRGGRNTAWSCAHRAEGSDRSALWWIPGLCSRDEPRRGSRRVGAGIR